ncbi:MAG: phenylalanine--tRNA ligase subunit beta [Patescibacteria group bacterium]|nr:phenylalanine--tRNA ligase subunit beta [Patescibacteria group bacterium]
MNIFLPDSWLREHLKTTASPKEIAKALSLCSQSVERIKKQKDDYLYEIEITTNRPDCLSVYGIARELASILPQFGHNAKLVPIAQEKKEIKKAAKLLHLKVNIRESSLCPRFTAIILDNVKVDPSPKKIQERLEKSGTRALNNVVDISNYLMLELGQPMHTFDYDKIANAQMILKETKKGEEIVTLDKKKRKLPEKTIVIEDGKGKLIDLCGIMGGANSAVDQNTKKVLLFVQTYDPRAIRNTCQKLGFRTDAAARFEKGVDPEGVLLGIKRAIAMFEKNCKAEVSSKLLDIYPSPCKEKVVKLDLDKVSNLIGVEIAPQKIKSILTSLGFKLALQSKKQMAFKVPHFRDGDISIQEDLIEEIARIYGYHNLPNNLFSGEIPQNPKNNYLDLEKKAKQLFKNWGFTEIFNYSMIGKSQASLSGIAPEKHLKIANPLTKDWLYLRQSILPSLLEVVSKNQANFSSIKVFEIANTYGNRGKASLPDEALNLSGLITDSDYKKAKGTIEALETLNLNLKTLEFKPFQENEPLERIFNKNRSAAIFVKSKRIGTAGEINQKTRELFGIKTKTAGFEISLKELVSLLEKGKKYKPISKYQGIVEDLSFIVAQETFIKDIIDTIKKIDKLIKEVKLIDSYQNTKTLRITYQSSAKNLSDKEISHLREKIIIKIEQKFKANLREKN